MIGSVVGLNKFLVCLFEMYGQVHGQPARLKTVWRWLKESVRSNIKGGKAGRFSMQARARTV
jgi:hypothetical protein